jgi:hypothetical protein
MQIKLFVCEQFSLLKICFKTDTSKGLLGKISFKFCMMNSDLLKPVSSKFYRHNIGTKTTCYYN